MTVVPAVYSIIIIEIQSSKLTSSSRVCSEVYYINGRKTAAVNSKVSTSIRLLQVPDKPTHLPTGALVYIYVNEHAQ